ncbi:hypothetical protein Drose_05655 [Dactylosporangium roseum]|uniref:Uncharacterized protein n=1 Tax=Dactylosporangium roseum TaxID=47989 RepID=A0ABY5Z9U4_9ACTN|nr:hypothetical protein [Dactylosporangium roseum]UWZ37755.1 hypothetical protein Drose_05655 [Dactylosporangium roseum]
MTSVTDVPYDADGNLLHYADRWQDAQWRANEPFLAVMALDGMRSGRSAKYVLLNDSSGRSYPMFVADLLDLLRRSNTGIRDGRTEAETWIVRKRGRNYGVALAPAGRTS